MAARPPALSGASAWSELPREDELRLRDEESELLDGVRGGSPLLPLLDWEPLPLDDIEGREPLLD